MGAALLQRRRRPRHFPGVRGGRDRRTVERAPRSCGDETNVHEVFTLDDLIAETWEGLGARGRVRCPVCNGGMVSGDRAAGEAPGGGCVDCGTQLA
jgi:hypothetical protein